MAEKKLSKKALRSGFHRWYYGNLTCFSQEHMQTFGYLCSMLPLCKELYADDPDKMAESMDTYRTFFNTEPQLGAIIVGVTAGLEEARANGAEDVDSETINGLRAGLMGPIAGIGDSLVVGTVIPILLGIAYFGMRFLYFKGYDMGTKAVEFLVGDIGTAIREAVTTLGGIVIGAVSATWVSVKTSFALYNEAGEAYMVLQEKLDSVFPGLLTAIFVIFCWWLMAKKRMSPLKVMGLLVVIAFVGVLVGFFNPGLSY